MGIIQPEFILPLFKTGNYPAGLFYRFLIIFYKVIFRIFDDKSNILSNIYYKFSRT